MLLSEIRSSINVSQFTNATHVFLPTPRVPTEGWTDHVTVSIAFVNFCVALTCFLVRYSSVFWYTNKPLTVVFALQLLAMAMNSIFSFNSFSVLYCVCHNKKMYPNITLSLSCPLDLVLYLFGSTILMLSTMTVFEYGCHYFHEKFNIVERHHHPETYVKQTVVVNNGCQGYVPHSCAMAALIVFAVCKGPLLYDLVSLMRLTGDQLLLSGIICEVCYMVLWVALWFCLTIKQQWQFRILDYVSLRQPLYALPEEKVVKYSHPGHGDATQNDTRTKRLSGRDFPQKYLEPVPAGTTSSEDPYHSDIGTDESDMINSAAEVILDLDGNPAADSNSSIRRSRMRKNGGQRVTFDESVRGKGPADKDKQQTPTNSLTRQGIIGVPRSEDISHFNVRADVHNSTPSTSNSSNESSQDGVVLRKKAAADNREYRNSIRNKCGEYYSSVNNLSAGFDEPAVSTVSEHLPTLMSSFRDKVRESSLAASTFKERERHMLEHFDYLDPLPPPIVEDLQSSEGEKRRVVAISDEDIGDVGYQLQKSNSDKMCSLGNSAADSSRYRQAGSGDDARARIANTEVRYRFDDNINDVGFTCDSNVNSSSLQRKLQHNTSISSDEGHRSSFANSTLESSDLSIPPAMEDLQLGGLRSVTGIGSSARKDDYLLPHIHHPSHLQHNVVGSKFKYSLQPRPMQIFVGNKNVIGRQDSANCSLTSFQDTSSNESENGQGLCHQV